MGEGGGGKEGEKRKTKIKSNRFSSKIALRILPIGQGWAIGPLRGGGERIWGFLCL